MLYNHKELTKNFKNLYITMKKKNLSGFSGLTGNIGRFNILSEVKSTTALFRAMTIINYFLRNGDNVLILTQNSYLLKLAQLVYVVKSNIVIKQFSNVKSGAISNLSTYLNTFSNVDVKLRKKILVICIGSKLRVELLSREIIANSKITFMIFSDVPVKIKSNYIFSYQVIINSLFIVSFCRFLLNAAKKNINTIR